MTKKVQSLLYFHRFALLVPIALAAVLLAARPGLAEGGTMPRDPAAFLTGFSGQAIEVLADRQMNDAQREVAFRRLFTAGFDIDMISRFVLGRYWRGASEPQRREYRQLFEDFIVATYARRLDGYSRETLQIGKVRNLSGMDIVVSSQVVRPREEPLRVDWRMARLPSNWRIVDVVVVEGISMAVTQRQEFASVIRNNGGNVEGLLKVLREKTGRSSIGTH